jgi:hypothetical protein
MQNGKVRVHTAKITATPSSIILPCLAFSHGLADDYAASICYLFHGNIHEAFFGILDTIGQTATSAIDSGAQNQMIRAIRFPSS